MTLLYQQISITVAGQPTYEMVFPNMAPGKTSPVQTIRITNVGLNTITNARLAAKLITGLVGGGTNEEGAEAMTGHWIEVRLAGSGSFQGIGGPYGNGTPAGNHFSLSDIAAAAHVDIDVRVTLPASPTTVRFARLRFGLSFQLV